MVKMKAEERIKIRDTFNKKTKKFPKSYLAKKLKINRTLIYLYIYKLRVPSTNTAIKLKNFLKEI